MKTAEEILDSFYSGIKYEYHTRNIVLNAMEKFASQFKAEQYPDTEADGYVFCGKCGKLKTL
jgi:hypothetical protein